MPIEDDVNEALKRESPQGKAVSALVDIKEHEQGERSDVELKTDLTRISVVNHSVVELLDFAFSLSIEDFKNFSPVTEFIQRKERKLVSLDRKSRQEIVEVARNPDTNIVGEDQQKGFMNRWLKRR